MTLKKLLKNLREEFRVGVPNPTGDGWHRIYQISSSKDIPEIDLVIDKKKGDFRFIAYGPGKDLYVFPVYLLHEDAAKKLKLGDVYHGTEPVIAGIAEEKNGKYVCRSSFNFIDAVSMLSLGGYKSVAEAKEEGKRSGIFLDNVMKFNWGWADKHISITPYLKERMDGADIKY